MINENGETMVEHHTHYKEIHGYDKTVWMTKSEHVKLHIRLRNSGKCTVSPDELNKIANAAGNRTDKGKIRCRKHQEIYRQSAYGKKHRREYEINNQQHIYFTESPEYGIELKERITYNYTTGSISYISGFYGTGGNKLINVELT